MALNRRALVTAAAGIAIGARLDPAAAQQNVGLQIEAGSIEPGWRRFELVTTADLQVEGEPIQLLLPVIQNANGYQRSLGYSLSTIGSVYETKDDG